MRPAASHALRETLEALVDANRILAREGVLDGYGHVSARHPDDPRQFLLSRSLAPELVTAEDIVTFDQDSNPIGDSRRPYLERFIHGEIYRRRPDVHAVVHSHSPSVVPFSASSVRMRPIYHMSSFLGAGTGVWDIRQHFGCTDMLVSNNAQGRSLAEGLGEDCVLLMRGHGFVAVAEAIPTVVFRAFYTEMNARLQASAASLGGTITFLEPDEAAMAEERIRGTIARPWELWRGKAAKPGR